MISRDTLFTDPGGDTVQIVSTAKYLKNFGVDVEIKLSKEVSEYHKFDIIHFFNIIRPFDIIYHIPHIKKIPFLISTIFVEYSKIHSNINEEFLERLIFKIDPDLREYIKVIARWLLKGEKIKSKQYLLRGHRWAVKKSLQSAAMLLPNSESEYRRLNLLYGVNALYKKIPNAIDTSIFNPNVIKVNENYKDAVVCVGRIERRKNQLRLIKAMKDSELKLVIIGKAAANQPSYYQACRNEAGNNVSFIDFLDQKEIASILGAAKVHVLPSWFETTGLVSLEAAAMGCNIVITEKGDQFEYFGNDVFYCDPAETVTIRKAIENAFKSPRNHSFQERVLREYTWQKAAEKTFEAYSTVLDSKNILGCF